MTGFDAVAIRYGWRARLGMILPSGNVAAEPQMAAMLPEGVGLHVTRLSLTGSSEAQLLGMTRDVEAAAGLLADAGVDLILFHCTAVSTWDPAMEGRLVARIEGTSGRPATATSRALLSALEALAIRRLVLVSPYIEAVNARESAYLEAHGVTVLRSAGLGIDGPQDMVKVEPGEWYRLARANDRPEADAVFISCTAVRSLEVVEALERDLCKPVITSNQVAAWHALRALGIRDRATGPGRLFSHP